MNADVEAVAPLDAYVTAKPDEPTFTLQGGDPLAPPIVRLWAILARLRAGVIQPSSIKAWVDGVTEVADSHSTGADERERDNLLLRATAAEEVSWRMDEYTRGSHDTPVDKPADAHETVADELKRISLHDLRVKVAQRLSNFSSETLEMFEALGKFEFDEGMFQTRLLDVQYQLQRLSDDIEPRRMMKRKTA